jgi:hypothetical protein
MTSQNKFIEKGKSVECSNGNHNTRISKYYEKLKGGFNNSN